MKRGDLLCSLPNRNQRQMIVYQRDLSFLCYSTLAVAIDSAKRYSHDAKISPYMIEVLTCTGHVGYVFATAVCSVYTT